MAVTELICNVLLTFKDQCGKRHSMAKKYRFGLMDDYTAKSDVFFLARKFEIYDVIQQYQVRSERMRGIKVQNFQVDSTGKNRS